MDSRHLARCPESRPSRAARARQGQHRREKFHCEVGGRFRLGVSVCVWTISVDSSASSASVFIWLSNLVRAAQCDSAAPSRLSFHCEGQCAFSSGRFVFVWAVSVGSSASSASGFLFHNSTYFTQLLRYSTVASKVHRRGGCAFSSGRFCFVWTIFDCSSASSVPGSFGQSA